MYGIYHLNMKTFLISIVLSLLFFQASADMPPPYKSYQIQSKNKKFVAKIVNTTPKKSVYESVWQLEIYNGVKKLWTKKFSYSGYKGGLLTDDGRTFIYQGFPRFHDLIFNNSLTQYGLHADIFSPHMFVGF